MMREFIHIHLFREMIRKLGHSFIIEMLGVLVRRRIAGYLKMKGSEARFTIEQASRKAGISPLAIRSTELGLYSIPLCQMTSLVDSYDADRFQYVMFINRLGIAIQRRRRAIEKICKLTRLAI